MLTAACALEADGPGGSNSLLCVAQVAANVLMIMSFYISLDAFQVILAGILRGTGRQAYAAPVIGRPCFVMQEHPLQCLWALMLGM